MNNERCIEISSYNEGRGTLVGEEGEGELGWFLLIDWVRIDCLLVEGDFHGFMEAGVIGETRLDVFVSIERGRMEGSKLIVSGERKSVIKSIKEEGEE